MANLYLLSDEYTIGVDEVGRGSLFGNVVVGAVILPTPLNDDDIKMYNKIKDSKKLSQKKRKELAIYIKDKALTFGIGEMNNDDIDKYNILQCTLKSSHKALNQAYLKRPFNKIIIDGIHFNGFIAPGIEDNDIIEYECIPKGDSKYLNIAAASIIAKDYHDEQIINLVNLNPELEKYDLLNNKGYGTEKHIKAIQTFGITKYHRKSFSGCK